MQFSLKFKSDLQDVKTIIVPHNPYTEEDADPKFYTSTNGGSYT